MHRVTEKLVHSLIRWKLLKPRESVLVAVSGGIDSMVLLHALTHLPPRWQIRPVVLHFNHGLRGRSSAADETFVKRYCQGEKLPCFVGRARPWRTSQNLQDRARRLRYRFFGNQAHLIQVRLKQAGRPGHFKLATAHQADDQAESFLMRWLQGAGLKGLSGIPLKGTIQIPRARALTVIRPLLLVSRNEIRDYAHVHKIVYREDASNRSDKYLRNRIRHLLQKLAWWNPRLAVRSASNALFLQEDEDYLQRVVARHFRFLSGSCLVKKGCSVAVYQRLHPAIRFRLLQKIFQGQFTQGIKGEGAALSGDHLRTLDDLLFSPEGRCSYHLPGGVIFLKAKGSFRLKNRR